MGHGFFCCGGSGLNSAIATVVADIVHRGVIDDGLVINVRDVRVIYVIHGAVVVKGSVIPISTLIAGTTVTVTIVDAAVEADILAPVAVVPSVGIAAPPPISGSPEQTSFGRLHPRTRHPEVALLSRSPIAGGPQITIGGNNRLLVHRQRRRGAPDRHGELGEHASRHHEYQNY